MQRLEIKESPFVNKVEYRGKAHWIKPQLVGNFKFATFTKSGRIRKPAIFLGFRTDKEAKDVIPEMVVEQKVERRSAKKLPALSPGSNWKKIEAQKFRHKEIIPVDDCDIEVWDIDREVWKGITKMELIQYYHKMSEYMLPHIKDRPQSLHIKPVNANVQGFYIKDMEGRQPECAEVFPDIRKHKKQGKRDKIDYLVCNNEATLVFMVNLGCIDINPWTSKLENINNPDFIIVDLDPSDEDFKKAIDTALAAKQVFDRNKIKAFVKTSGKTGIHLYLPCNDFDFSQARTIAENLCNEIHQLVKSVTTTNVSVASRGNKLYLDPNQNDYADTVAAAYSARPYHIPTVSTPLEWKEIKPSLDPSEFTIHSIVERVEKKGDLFLGVLDRSIAKKNNKSLSGFL
jgi:bifunctional non-homologous end joining protein LigD